MNNNPFYRFVSIFMFKPSSVKYLLLVPVILLFISNVQAEKFYKYSYDNNGNRVSFTYMSTCRTKPPVDSVATDTLKIKDIVEFKAVSSPEIYPNPVEAYFTLSFPVLEEPVTLIIYDMNGSIVYQEDRIMTLNSVINACGLAKGTYAVTVLYSDNKTFVKKIIKK